jgi:SpoVK/Ycf46/Vps4 family AAA+-type ATPase
LGTDEKTLETELRIVLSRSQRWKAILLIDEADVYVHERGDDIQQNAIVGVFLRVLEYYRGILFMTSNRETIIDDAIMSRATAWIRYEVPDKEKAKLIWRVLSTQYKAQLSLDQIAELVEHEKFNEISGRTIKNLLKLAKLKSLRNKETITPEMLKYVSQFLDLEGASTRKAA